MEKYFELTDVAAADFAITGELDHPDSCQEIIITLPGQSMRFRNVSSYHTHTGFINWIGLSHGCLYLIMTQSETTGNIYACCHSEWGYFEFIRRSGQLSLRTCDKQMKAKEIGVERVTPPATHAWKFTLDIAFAYHQSYLESESITEAELALKTENEVAFFNVVLTNSGLGEIVVESKGLYNVSYEDLETTSIEAVFDSFFYQEEAAQDLLRLHEEKGSDILYFYGVVPDGSGASAGLINQIHHSLNFIIERSSIGKIGAVAHESGHLFGFHHDWGMSEIRSMLPNNGHAYSPETGTIMSYSTSWVPYYSNLLHKYPDTDVIMGAENRNNCGFAQSLNHHGLTPLQQASQAYEMREMPSLKLHMEEQSYFERIEYVDIFTNPDYDLLKDAEVYSPVNEQVTVENIGDTVIGNRAGFYVPVLKLTDESGRVNFLKFYILLK